MYPGTPTPTLPRFDTPGSCGIVRGRCARQEGGLKNSGRETHDDIMNQIAVLRNSDFGLPIPDGRVTKAAQFAGACRGVSRLIAQLARVVPAGPALSRVVPGPIFFGKRRDRRQGGAKSDDKTR
jgi:hypothetical protein